MTDALGWRPGDRYTVRLRGDALVVTADPTGAYAVSGCGRVHLPADLRHACAIAPGDRALLAAEPTDNVLVVYPPAALDAMINNRDRTELPS